MSTNGFIKVEKGTIIFLALFSILLGIFSVLYDLSLINLTFEMGTVVGLLFLGVVSSETIYNAIVRKKFGGFEIISIILVFVTMLSLIFNWLSMTNALLTTIGGTVKALLMIVAIILIFTD